MGPKVHYYTTMGHLDNKPWRSCYVEGSVVNPSNRLMCYYQKILFRHLLLSTSFNTRELLYLKYYLAISAIFRHGPHHLTRVE